MKEMATDMKALVERLAEELARVPGDKRELVAALLLGTCNGIQIADQLSHQRAAVS
jgi:hypothetical protein